MDQREKEKKATSINKPTNNVAIIGKQRPERVTQPVPGNKKQLWEVNLIHFSGCMWIGSLDPSTTPQ